MPVSAAHLIVVDCDIPADLTLREYRRRTHPRQPPLARRCRDRLRRASRRPELSPRR